MLLKSVHDEGRNMGDAQKDALKSWPTLKEAVEGIAGKSDAGVEAVVNEFVSYFNKEDEDVLQGLIDFGKLMDTVGPEPAIGELREARCVRSLVGRLDLCN